MSLIRQVWLLLGVTLALAIAGGFGISVESSRRYLAAQLTMKNNDMAQSLGLSLSQQHGDPTAMELLLTSQFDTGFYEQMRLVAPDGKVLIDRKAPLQKSNAPAWFVGWMGLAPDVGIALVSDGWKQIGRLEVRSQSSFTVDQLWRSTLLAAWLLAFLALMAGAVARYGLARIKAPLSATVQQAMALTERRFVTVAEPHVPELREVTRAMNLMVDRLRLMFDEQAGQVEVLRRQAHCDDLTGVFNRPHFLGRLKGLLSAEDGSASGVLVLVRVCDLQGINRTLGRAEADVLLREAAAAIEDSGRRSVRHEIGRLNGSDFALVLPDVQSLRESAVDVAAKLRTLFRTHEGNAFAVVGAVRWWHGASVSSLLAAADQALARAEARGAFAVDLDDAGDGLVLGEDAWRVRLEQALEQQWVELAKFAMVDVQGDVIHFECPLRLRLESDGPPVPAAQWLPMARRTQLTWRIDLLAVEAALSAIAGDGLPRSVNLSPSSLADDGFLPALRQLLQQQRASAPGLWLEVAEAGAMRSIELVRALVDQAHAVGAKVGLEHAGEQVTQSGRLLEAGLDFVKLDASLVDGIAESTARRQHIASMLLMLHGIGLAVYAEGVNDEADAQALWDCGIDGVTGPVVKRA